MPKATKAASKRPIGDEARERRTAKKAGRGPAVSDAVIREVWARSGGICAFPDCDKILYEDPGLLETGNFGDIAHNVASSALGVRGHAERSHALSNDPNNLLLFCPLHHKYVDNHRHDKYPESVLSTWKAIHEANVRQAAMFKGSQRALPLIIRGPIRGQPVTVVPGEVMMAMMHAGISPVMKPFDIALDGDGGRDAELTRWMQHVGTMRARLSQLRHAEGIEKSPISVFPLAEMPLLIYAGSQFGDKTPMQVFQYRRWAASWCFEDINAPPESFDFDVPKEVRGPIAITFGMTAPIARERFTHLFDGRDFTLIEFTTPDPGTALVRGPKTIEGFQSAVRRCLDEIEQRVLDRTVELHFFPVMPAPLAFALGRCVMLKVSQPIVIYDAEGPQALFHEVLRLSAN